MIYHGFKTSTTPGTAVALASKRTMASFVTVFPRKVAGIPNTGEVRIGGNPALTENQQFNGVQTGIPTGSGMPLLPGDAGVLWPMPAPAPVDLATVYLDVNNSGDGVQFVYGKP